MNVLEIHLLQNVASSNLNRDDTGSPKDAFFGGKRRARVSSQCWKRAIRATFAEANLLSSQEMGVRTKNVMNCLVDRLVAEGKDREEAQSKVQTALEAVGLSIDTKKGNATEYLLFLGYAEIDHVQSLIVQHWDELQGKKANKKDKSTLPADVLKVFKNAFDSVDKGTKAVDVALFGRMLADASNLNREAACQVAHALSTHTVEREFDFFTAVDDLQAEDSSGAGMLGTVEFNSACYYRYAALDLNKLHSNLNQDADLVMRAVRAFVTAFVEALPTGKQNSFAAHNMPEYVLVCVRPQAAPRNLANAFEVPVKVTPTAGYLAQSVDALSKKYQRLATAYGQEGQAFVLNLVRNAQDEPVQSVGQDCSSLDALVEATLAEVQTTLGV